MKFVATAGIGLILILAASGANGAAADSTGPMEALRSTDLRLAVIADRLVTGNAGLCRDLQPALGFAFQAIDQYPMGSRTAARAVFGFEGPIAIEAIVPGSPAAGQLEANDAIVAVNDTPMPAATSGAPTGATRDAAWAILAAQKVGAPIKFALKRRGEALSVSVASRAACRAAFEILSQRGQMAQSDGRIVQVGEKLMAQCSDDEVAVVVAHELAHIILRHRARLEAAGVRWGLLAGLGKNGRLFRRTEEDADRLSVALLRNAGYDPRIASAFWRGTGAKWDDPIGSLTHAGAKKRVALIDEEIARIPANAPALYVPAILDTRDQPLS